MKIPDERRATLTYVAALSIIGSLSIGSHLVVDSIVKRQEESARILNISGRQRALSQRIAMTALELALPESGVNKDYVRLLMNQSIQLMAISHAALAHGSGEFSISPKSVEPAHDIYFSRPYLLNDEVSSFLTLAREIADLPENELRADHPKLVDLRDIARRSILEGLDLAVTRYETAAETAIERLRAILFCMLAAMLTTLAAEAAFIFRPLFQRLRANQLALVEAARTDPLTGCFNRRYLMEMGERYFALARRHGQPLSVVILDIDRFKRINDTYGHLVGDEVIRSLARNVVGAIRVSDLFGRLGGEEFALVLPETPLDAAMQVSEKLRVRLSEIRVDSDIEVFSFTASFGVSEIGPADKDILDPLGRADQALYAAKNGGRNRVCVA